MANRAVGRVLARGAKGELVKVALSHDDSAGCAQPFDDGRVRAGNVGSPHAGGGGRRDAAHVDEVFDRDGDAVERAATAPAGDFLIGVPRGLPGGFREDCDEGVQPGVLARDARETALGDLFGGDAPGGNLRRQLGNRQQAVIGHDTRQD